MANPITVTVYPVKDLEAAKKFYSTYLGTEPYVDGAYYVGYKVGDVEVGLDPNATVGPIVYTDTKDITAAIAEMTAAGAEVVKEPGDVGGGLLIATVKDETGNVVGFRQQP
ncbi:VOC family protein [Candidatus Saccharibacteria bacterium]|nr:VOC family protein [Candidatus Saccharibacteria bacterium]